MEAVTVKCEIGDEPTEFSIQDVPESENPTFGNGVKCGDIFFFDGDKFSFFCYFCSENFTEYEKFTDHIKEDHARMFIPDYGDFPVTPEDASLQPDIKLEIDVENEAVAPVIAPPVRKKPTPKKIKEAKSTVTNEQSANTEEDDKQEEKKFSCGICRAKFLTENGMLKHKRNHMSGQMATHKNKFLSESLDCRYCGRIFVCKANRIEHETIHTGEKPYQCPICSKFFREKRKMAEHKRIHSGERPFKCDHCEVAFGRKSSLKDHIKRAHLHEKQFKCEFCPKSFVSSTDRMKHARVHTRPYKCDICSAAFPRLKALKMHLQTHAEKPMETQKEVECEIILP